MKKIEIPKHKKMQEYIDFFNQNNEHKFSVADFEEFDEYFDIQKYHQQYFFRDFFHNLLLNTETSLTDLEKQLEFLFFHFRPDLRKELAVYFLQSKEVLQYIQSIEDLKLIDEICHSSILSNFICPSDLTKREFKNWQYDLLYKKYIPTFSWDCKNKYEYINRLTLMNMIEPDKKHIVNFFVYVLKRSTKYKFKEHLEKLSGNFPEHELFANDIVLQYAKNSHRQDILGYARAIKNKNEEPICPSL